MPIQRRAPFPHKGYIGRKGVIKFQHEVTVGASGAITTQDLQKDSGVALTKQAGAGQYLVTLPNGYKKMGEVDVWFQTAMATTTAGMQWDVETNNVDRGTGAGNFLLQFRRPDTLAVADLPNPCTFTLIIGVVEGV